MNINDYDYVGPKGVEGKIILTCFPGRNLKEYSFDSQIFFDQIKNLKLLNCSAIVSLVEDAEFEKMYEKKLFVREIYKNNLNWFHLPIEDLQPPNHKFIEKWQTTKSLLKNDLIDGKNIAIHCMGGKGRSGTIAAILLIEFGDLHKDVIKVGRKKRKGAIETEEQEKFILNYNRIK